MSKITVVRSTTTKADKGYTIVELAYKTDEGKTKGMKIFGFGAQKENSEVASAAKAGDVLDVTFQQNTKGFWEFGSIKSTGEVVAQAATNEVPGRAGKTPGNWETSEERASRQALISRQAVLNTAVAYFEAAKAKPTKEDVVEVARYFLTFVNQTMVPQVIGDVE